MPCLTTPAKVLITGVNGYLAAHVAKDLLERVVGTVRSSAKGDEMAKRLHTYGSRFSYVVIQDMAQPGAFDEVLRTGDFDGVAHIAVHVSWDSTPFTGSPDISTEGTLNILRGIQAHGPGVKRVVLTSTSLAAVPSQPGSKDSEVRWDDDAVRIAQEKGSEASIMERYKAMKVWSEKAAWKFVEDNKSKINFDLVTILPGLITGTPVNDSTPLEQLSSSNHLFEQLRSPPADEKLGDAAQIVIHAKDAAAIHSEAFFHEEAAGRRVLAITSQPSWQDIYNALNEEPAFPGFPKGRPGVGERHDTGSEEWNLAFTMALLGREAIGAKETIREIAAYFHKAGWRFTKE
ncbi:NAD-P-binding protein [Rhizoctonia solani]|uniref:NAD-P-binding protein n=1 Tax=Rhizoctonia solani TaxID=456999 RepID=A0A8H7M244_9AGAM|nr:NAD-P-binding protein [Rhizoctonia solani]KAF8751831.1 NAD-P-binding protein [Rhizoctonia solani]